MKKIIASIVLFLAVVSCYNIAEVQLPVQEIDSNKGITITATLEPKTPVTKAVADNGDDKITTSWAEGESIAIIYDYMGPCRTDAEIIDVDGEGRATISFIVYGNPDDNTPCKLVYPASATNDALTGAKYPILQNGALSADLDVRIGEGTIQISEPGLTVTTQPAAQFAIFKFTLTTDESTSIRGLIVKDDFDALITNVTPSLATNTLYVAIPPTYTGTEFRFIASDGTKKYTKTLHSTKPINAGRYYHSTLNMENGVSLSTVNLSEVPGDYVANDFVVLTGSTTTHKVTIADGATVTLNNASINYNGSDGAAITCAGNASIILSGTNSLSVPGDYSDDPVYGLTTSSDYPAILVGGAGTKLIITGTGTLNAIGGGAAAGIGCMVSYPYGYTCGIIQIDGGTINAYSGHTVSDGDGFGSGIGSVCGAPTGDGCEGIIINGGTVTAKGGSAGIGSAQGAFVGSITIKGGTVTATGGDGCPGIGAGAYGYCGPITISSAVTGVTAIKGTNAPNSIGAGASNPMIPLYSSCGPVTIGGTLYWDGENYQNGGDTYLATSPLVYPASTPGALNGLFTVNASGDQIRFSQGNLQYQASSGTWRFAEHQWVIIGNTEGNTTSNENGRSTQEYWIDLFGWGTGANPTQYDSDFSYYATFNEWGNNAISNGGNTTGLWRTLTHTEWSYLIGAEEYNRRTDEYRFLYATITVSDNTYSGLILLPDGFTGAGVDAYNYNNADLSSSDSVSAEDWVAMETAGAVFLPYAGRRDSFPNVHYPNEEGYYWASDYAEGGVWHPDMYSLCIRKSSNVCHVGFAVTADEGGSVRLVRDVN